MVALLKMSLKVSFVVFKRLLLIVILLIGFWSMLTGRADFTMLYFASVWLLLTAGLSLRIKAQREKWNHFLVPLTGRHLKLANYLYVFTILLSILITIVGLGLYALLTEAGVLRYEPGVPFQVVAVTNGVLFYYLILLLVSEVVDYEKLLMLQRFSLLAIVVLLRLLMDLDLSGLKSYATLVAPAVIGFNYGGVFFFASYLFTRRSRVLVGA